PPPLGPPFVEEGLTEVVLPPGPPPPGPPVTETPGTVVPEPSAWALMILGFGAVGVGLRRRRAITA
ncbi:MAG: hypothetical protein DI570_21305, partial [Phenylobacterium zucineum]